MTPIKINIYLLQGDLYIPINMKPLKWKQKIRFIFFNLYFPKCCIWTFIKLLLEYELLELMMFKMTASTFNIHFTPECKMIRNSVDYIRYCSFFFKLLDYSLNSCGIWSFLLVCNVKMVYKITPKLCTMWRLGIVLNNPDLLFLCWHYKQLQEISFLNFMYF